MVDKSKLNLTALEHGMRVTNFIWMNVWHTAFDATIEAEAGGSGLLDFY